jgi:hypothetical protein
MQKIMTTTGFTPFYLMLGRTPQLPVNAMFGSVLRDETILSYSEFVDSFQRYLQEAMRIAQKNTKAQKKQAREHDKKVKGCALEVGDKVLFVPFLLVG